MKINIKKLTDTAIVPTRAHNDDAGHDLYADMDWILLPDDRQPIKTGISMSIPTGFYGRVAPRSGLAVKKGIDVLAGVVDATYRGEIMVVLINLGKVPFEIKMGDKIAQLIFERCESAEFEVVDNLDATTRNEGGFGSSDKTLIQG